ncbi:hypothetical protein EZS27_003941 [termite gut metagenome]|uniref:Uncharacterized protein n=1 Tax=termite gut metagenome TaxID=433724 RepID=A0A5J4SS17_9ZZZZ
MTPLTPSIKFNKPHKKMVHVTQKYAVSNEFVVKPESVSKVGIYAGIIQQVLLI